MDHFRRSMSVRTQIISDKPLLKKLACHFLEQRKLDEGLGNGSNNIHYRAGPLASGLWVATRQQFGEPIPYGDPARSDAMRARMRETGHWKTDAFELFCREAYCWSEFGGFGINRSVAEFVERGGPGYVTSFCIGVRYKPLWRSGPLYALLVEDLTAGGAFMLEKHEDHDWKGRIAGVEGFVQIDLDDGPMWRKRHPEAPRYMTEEAMIDFGGM
ncbi:MAG: hypothetical protein AB1324_08180 [Candidatus Micrarchaeota archaeon]